MQRYEAAAFQQRGEQLSRAGENQAALEAFDNALEVDPTSTSARASKIYTLLQLSDMPTARQEWQLLENMAGTRDDPLALRAIGAMSTFYGQFDHAIDALRQSLEVQPEGNRLARLNLIAVLATAGRFEEAEHEISQYDVYYPPAAANGWVRIRLAFAREDFDQMASFIESEAQIDRSEPGELAFMAEMQRSVGLLALSQTTYQQALDLLRVQIAAVDYDPFFLEREIPELLFGIGNAEQAISMLDQQIEEQVGDAVLLSNRCWIRARANIDRNAALSDCRMARDEDPESYTINFQLAWVYLALGRFEDARATFNSAQGFSDRSEAFYYGRAIANFRLGNSQGAADDLAMARYLNSRFDADVDAIADLDRWFPELILSAEDLGAVAPTEGIEDPVD